MTARIREFLRKRADDGPCLVVDLDVVRENYLAFAKALPDTKVFYAVKANPAPEVLALLAGLGSSFDTASVAEVEMVLAAGAKPDRISFGNTIKKERDVARAYALGVRLFVLQGKRLVPTAAALALLDATDEVSAVLARCEQTLGNYREDGSGPRATLPTGTSERELALSAGRA